MIFEAAIGDAYGAWNEYVDPRADRPNDLSRYWPHPRHAIGNGRYTDDTEMSTAVLEAMLEGPLTPERLAHWFVAAFHREQRKGYAGRFYDFLVSTKDGADFLARIDPKSDKSGAAMRGWVTGLYPTIPEVLAAAEMQAKVTHDTLGGIISSQAAALMTHYFAYGLGAPFLVGEFVNRHVEGPWNRPYTGSVGSKGMESVHAAFAAVQNHHNLADILKACIDFRGDVDTVATIALGAASLSDRIYHNLPAVLVDGLENGPWGKTYLTELDRRVKERFYPVRGT